MEKNMHLRNKPTAAIVVLTCCAAFLASCVTGGMPTTSYHLVKDGQTASCIVLPDNAGPVEKHAAGELALFIEKVTGAKVPVGNAPSQELYNIYLGTTAAKNVPRSEAIDKAVTQLKGDGFLLAADKDGLRVIGREPIGVLYGAYEILKKYAGMRWLVPGPEGEYCPKATSLSVPEQAVLRNPSFPVRTVEFHATRVNVKLLDSWDWLVRNGMRITSNFCTYQLYPDELAKRAAIIREGGHAFYLFISDSLLEAHSEYFPLINGKRVGQEGQKNQPCTTHPDVIAMVSSKLNQFIEKLPKEMSCYFILGNNDGTGWCQCPECAKIDPPQEKEKRFVSTRYWTFVNAVASNVFKMHPDTDLWGWAYQNFQAPPVGVTPDQRLSVMLSFNRICYRHSLTDTNCTANIWYRNCFLDWSRLGNKISTREEISPSGGMYLPIEKVFIDNLKFYHEIGIGGVAIACAPIDGFYSEKLNTPRAIGLYLTQWPAMWQNMYLAAQFLWDIDSDYQQTVEDMGRAYYGAAWPIMREYRELLTRLFVDTPGDFGHGTPALMIGKCLNKPFARERLHQLLTAAEKAAVGDKLVLARVRFDSKLFTDIWEQYNRQYLSFSREIVVDKRAGQIVIDGQLDENDWMRVDAESNFVTEPGKPADQQTFVKLLYDPDYIYLALEAMEPSPDAIQADHVQRDGDLWLDNSMEIFISLPDMGAGYYHLIFNSKGILYDSLCVPGQPTDLKFNSRAEIKTVVLKDRWVAEIKIPTAALGEMIQDGATWQMNVARVRVLKGREHATSTWSTGAFHNRESFLPIVFGKTAPFRNGSFNEVEKEKNPHTNWTFGSRGLWPESWWLGQTGGALEMALHPGTTGNYFVKLQQGYIFQIYDGDKKNLRINFRAAGHGKFLVNTYSYRVNKDPAAGKYTSLGSKIIATCEVSSPDWKSFEFKHQITGQDEQVAVGFEHSAGEICLDDVSVTPFNP